jgi:hypothetical protein
VHLEWANSDRSSRSKFAYGHALQIHIPDRFMRTPLPLELIVLEGAHDIAVDLRRKFRRHVSDGLAKYLQLSTSSLKGLK